MKRVLLTLVVVALSATMAMAAGYPAMQIVGIGGALDNSVTPSIFYGGAGPLTIEANTTLAAGGAQMAFGMGIPSSNDYLLSATVSTATNTEVGLAGRGDANGNAYLATINFNAGGFNLIKVSNFAVQNLVYGAPVGWTISPTSSYKVELAVQGDLVFGRVTDLANPSNTCAYFAKDSTFSSGAIGVILAATSGVPGTGNGKINGTFSSLYQSAASPGIILGDTNWNNAVNVTDLGNLLANYGTTYTPGNTPAGMGWSNGDLDFDGDIDVTDLGNLLSNYGAGGSVQSGVVPEPSTIGLILAGLMASALYWVRKRR